MGRGESVLSGAVNGKVAFGSMIKEIDREPDAPTPLFLDFRNVEVATASYLRESVFSLKAYMRATGSQYYPVAANANESVYDELLTVANAKGDAILNCLLDDSDRVTGVELIGQLDPKQQMTFDLVQELKRASAGQLMETAGDSEGMKGQTAWNNRLAGLVAKGIIREFANGRSKYYRPVLEVIDHGV